MTDNRINNNKYFNTFKPLKCLFTGKSAHLQFVDLQTAVFRVFEWNIELILSMLNEIKRGPK